MPNRAGRTGGETAQRQPSQEHYCLQATEKTEMAFKLAAISLFVYQHRWLGGGVCGAGMEIVLNDVRAKKGGAWNRKAWPPGPGVNLHCCFVCPVSVLFMHADIKDE